MHFAVRRFVVRNYRSIAACDVTLGDLVFLVGPNGAGKSNFLDALRLTADSLRTSLDHALRDRGGIAEVRRRSGGHPTHFGVRAEYAVGAMRGSYSFRVAAKSRGGYEVQDEECRVERPEIGSTTSWFRVNNGSVTSSEGAMPAAAKDRLYLVAASGLPAFRPVFDGLAQMGFYNLNPDAIGDLQSPDAGDLLARDGSNLASVLARMTRTDVDQKLKVEEYLSKVVPGLAGVDAKSVGPKESLEFRQRVAGATAPWRFPAGNMSDGTLRALGVLVALFQRSPDPFGQSLIGIEEPEVALHPWAAGVLLDALQDASDARQVLVTSHSPDLLDSGDLPIASIKAVMQVDGNTVIAGLDRAGVFALQKALFTPGELLRQNQLLPDVASTQLPGQMGLFEDVGAGA